jgi:DHA1 family multidrug resistance protein-like MFS transporter
VALACLLAATALYRASQNMAQTTFSLLGRERLGLGAGTLGVLAAVSGLTTVLVMVTLAARTETRRAPAGAAVASVVLALALGAFALTRPFALFLVAVLALGVAGGLGQPALASAVGATPGERRERALALYALTLSASLGAGPLLETLVLDRTGQDLRAPFVAFLGLPLLGAGLLVGAARAGRPRAADAPPPTALGRELARPGHPAPPAASARPCPASSGAASPAPRARTGGLLSSREGRVALVVQLLYAVPFSGITVFGALVARTVFGASPAGAQLAFAAFFSASFAARGAVALLAPVRRKGAAFAASAALTAGGLVLLGTGHGMAQLVAAMAVLGVPHGLTYPLVLALVAESTPPVGLPRANAMLMGPTTLASVVAPVVLGEVADLASYRAMVLSILVPVGAFGLLLGLVARVPRATLPEGTGPGRTPGEAAGPPPAQPPA